MFHHSICVCGLTVAVAASIGAAQYAPTQTASLQPNVGMFIGIDVALHGDVAFVNAPHGLISGSTRVVQAYRKIADVWTLEQTLTHPDAEDIRFGWSLDFDGTTLVVGSPSLPKLDAPAVATVYTHNGSEWVGTDLPAPPQEGIGYATDVAVDDDLILVGAPAFDIPTTQLAITNGGAAYAYRRNAAGEWKLKQELIPPTAFDFMVFGISVDIAGTSALLGASGGDRAYAFEWNQGTLWTLTQILTPSVATPDSAFGEEVKIDAQRAVIGAWQDDTFADRGAAFVFEQTCRSWKEMQRLDAPAGASTYGRAVDIYGDTVIVGAQSEDVGGVNGAGAAHAYRWDGSSWGYEQRLVSASPQALDSLGRSIAIDGDLAMAGAIGASAGQPGKVLLFEAAPITPPWTDLGFPLAGSDVATLAGTGTLQANTSLELTVDCGPASGTGTLVVGLSEINVPFKGGVIVPDPLLLVSGLGLSPLGSLVLPATWPAGVPVDTTLAMQMWFSDAAGPLGFSSTNALRLSAK